MCFSANAIVVVLSVVMVLHDTMLVACSSVPGTVLHASTSVILFHPSAALGCRNHYWSHFAKEETGALGGLAPIQKLVEWRVEPRQSSDSKTGACLLAALFLIAISKALGCHVGQSRMGNEMVEGSGGQWSRLCPWQRLKSLSSPGRLLLLIIWQERSKAFKNLWFVGFWFWVFFLARSSFWQR